MRDINSPLGDDIKKVLTAYQASSGASLIDLVLQTKSGLKIAVERIEEIFTNRDFGNARDDTSIVITCKRSVYEKLIIPNRSELTALLTITPCRPDGSNPGQPSNVTYTAIVDTPTDESILHGEFTGTKLSDKDGDVMSFALSLVEKAFDELIPMNFCGIPAETTVENLITCVTSGMGRFPIYVHAPDNDVTHPHIEVPMSVAAFDLPLWLQNNSVGVYDYGVGTYFLNGWVYVYPLAKLQPSPDRPKMVILRTTPNETAGIENTYAVEGDTIYVICNSKAIYKDDTEHLERELGNTIRWSDSDMWGKVVKHSNGEHEFANHQLKIASKANRRVNITKVHERLTSNSHYERSRLTALNGKMVTLVWENANGILVKPDTEVEIRYMSDGELMTLSGIIASYTQTYKRSKDKGTRAVFSCTGSITTLLS